MEQIIRSRTTSNRAMRQRLILHIGTHKTGTTSLQHYLEEHRAENLAAFGLYYPMAGTRRSSLHTALAKTIRARRAVKRPARKPTADKVIERITADIIESGASTAIVSAEGLSGPRPEFAEACQAFSLHFDVAIALVLRRQDRFVESLYSQFVRGCGETRCLHEFMAAKQIRSWLDYRRTLGFWESAFGRSAIHVIPYEAAIREQGLLKSFFSVLSLPPPVVEPRSRNLSPAREAIEVLRYINREAGVIGKSHAHRSKRRRLLAAMQKLTIDSGRTDVLGTDSRRKLLQTFAEGNAEIAQRYLERRDGRLFAEDDLQIEHPVDDWHLPLSELVGHLSRLASHFASAPRSPGSLGPTGKQATRNTGRKSKIGGRMASSGKRPAGNDNHRPRREHRRAARSSAPTNSGD